MGGRAVVVICRVWGGWAGALERAGAADGRRPPPPPRERGMFCGSRVFGFKLW